MLINVFRFNSIFSQIYICNIIGFHGRRCLSSVGQQLRCQVGAFFVSTYNDATIPISGTSTFVLAESRDFQITFSNDPKSDQLISVGSAYSRSLFHFMKDGTVHEDDHKGWRCYFLNITHAIQPHICVLSTSLLR